MKLKIKVLQISLFALLTLAFSFLACNKEKSGEGTPDQEEAASVASSESDGEAENIFNGLFDDVMGVNTDVALGGTGVFGLNLATGTGGSDATARIASCPDVTISLLNPPALFPKKVVLDFGAGCTASDGHLRRGKIIIVYTNGLRIPGASATTEFDGFYIDSIKVEGTHKITNVAEINAVAKKWKVEIIAGRLTKPNGDFTEWNRTNIITQIENVLTTTVRDWIFKIEGYGNGHTRRNGIIVAWNAEIIDPLIKRFNCRWIVRGQVRIRRVNVTNTTRWEGIIDFGSGTCDNKATVTVNGHIREIILR
jgi:hypothetical protein